MSIRQTAVQAQNARRDVLSQLRRERALNSDEAVELDRLDHAFYMRSWRAQQREKYGKAINVLSITELRNAEHRCEVTA